MAKRSKRFWTKIVLAGVLAALIGWDVYVFGWGENRSTISEIIRDWSFEGSFLIPVAWGVLTGHFFWPLKPDPRPKTPEPGEGAQQEIPT